MKAILIIILLLLIQAATADVAEITQRPQLCDISDVNCINKVHGYILAYNSSLDRFDLVLGNGTGGAADGNTQHTTDGIYLYNDTTKKYFNETKLNETISEWTTNITAGSGEFNQGINDTNGTYLENGTSDGTNYIWLNETKLNETIIALEENDTTIPDTIDINAGINQTNDTYLMNTTDGETIIIWLNETKLNETVADWTNNITGETNNITGIGGQWYFPFWQNKTHINQSFTFYDQAEDHIALSRDLYLASNVIIADPIKIGSGATTDTSGGVAIGLGAEITGGVGSAVAIGTQAEVQETRSVAIGFQAIAGTTNTISIGSDASTTGTNSISIGRLSSADGSSCVSLGTSSQCSNTNSLSFGINSESNNESCIAIGDSANCTAPYSLTLGWNSKVEGTTSNVAIGNANVLGTESSSSFAMGGASITNGLYSVAIGVSSTIGGTSPVYDDLILGRTNTIYNANDSIIIGKESVVTANECILIGNGLSCIEDGTVSIGGFIMNENTTQGGINASCEGQGSICFGQNATAEGDDSIAMGKNSHAIQNKDMAIGYSTFANDSLEAGGALAIGYNSEAHWLGAVAIGLDANASGLRSVAFSQATASGSGSFAWGQNALASGWGTLSAGVNSEASGWASIAIGNGALADQSECVAIGSGADCSGSGAMALGGNSTAEGEYAVAIGNQSNASANNCVAIGRYANCTEEGEVKFSNDYTSFKFGDQTNNNSDLDVFGNLRVQGIINMSEGGWIFTHMQQDLPIFQNYGSSIYAKNLTSWYGYNDVFGVGSHFNYLIVNQSGLTWFQSITGPHTDGYRSFAPFQNFRADLGRPDWSDGSMSSSRGWWGNLFLLENITSPTATVNITELEHAWNTTENITATKSGEDLTYTYNAAGEIAWETDNAKFIIYNEPSAGNDWKIGQIYHKTGGTETGMTWHMAGPNNATHSYRSLRVGGAPGPNCGILDPEYHIDCNTSTTGADAAIQDDIFLGGRLISGNGTLNTTDEGNISMHGSIIQLKDNSTINTSALAIGAAPTETIPLKIRGDMQDTYVVDVSVTTSKSISAPFGFTVENDDTDGGTVLSLEGTSKFTQDLTTIGTAYGFRLTTGVGAGDAQTDNDGGRTLVGGYHKINPPQMQGGTFSLTGEIIELQSIISLSGQANMSYKGINIKEETSMTKLGNGEYNRTGIYIEDFTNDSNWNNSYAIEIEGGSIHMHNSCGVPSGVLIAEENAALGTTAWEWAWGNGGAAQLVGHVTACSGEITAMTVQCNTCTGTTTTVRVMINGTTSGCTTDIDTATYTGSGKFGIDNDCDGHFTEASTINFQTLDNDGTCSNCVATAYVRYD